MTQSMFKPQAHNVLLSLIKEGMTVVDASNKPIGTVTYIRFGEDNYNETQVDPKPVSEQSKEGWYDYEDVSNELESRLLHTGYIRIDGGLFITDRFAMPHQIEDVIGERVTLRVPEDELISL